MSDRESKREMEGEEEILHHFLHKHPLSLIEDCSGDTCVGCGRYLTSGEAAYGCSKKCGYNCLLHEECAEMPREMIKHPLHPQHLLIQKLFPTVEKCAFCGGYIVGHSYYCAPCKFTIHIGCAAATMGVMHTADYNEEEEEAEKQRVEHPSHPTHKLILLRGSITFRCDACGTIEKGNTYVCTGMNCQFMIHKSCASLPTTMERQHLHNHPLSLAFRLPMKYLKFRYTCEICSKALPFKYWVYHCELCSYAVHIQCAIKTSSPPDNSTNNADAADHDENINQFPINDVCEELIRPFVTRERGDMIIPHEPNKIMNGKYWFHNHQHQLRLISFEGDDGGDDDDDDDDFGLPIPESICDACTMPIYQKKKQNNSLSFSSSSLRDSHKYYYYTCGECKYFFHLACLYLPPELPSHTVRNIHHHNLMLQTCPDLKFLDIICNICYCITNGFIYACTECNFKADIKCASLPNAIKHAAHPQHHHYLKLLLAKDINVNARAYICGACGYPSCGYPDSGDAFYKCDSCEFSLHCRCVLLPAANYERRWDKHPLPLTYDANINHPSDFYCDICEGEMNPKRWMYHCRECDHSFHPHCFSTTSGRHKNIKFGQQYVIAACHNHPLTYQVITTKLRCDHCRETRYGRRGLECASCNFVMCLYPCVANHQHDIEAIR